MATPTTSAKSKSYPIPHSDTLTRYHPYSLNPDLLQYRRNGPSSIASTSITSYAPSIASTATTVLPPLPSQKQNNIRVKVNTSVAPSSHIWDEFYREHGRPQGGNRSKSKTKANVHKEYGSTIANEEEGTHGALAPRQATSSLPSEDVVQTNDIGFSDHMDVDTALTEILSMFNIPSTTGYPLTTIQNSNHGTSNHRLPDDGVGDYPGAEFLNLPDTASTIDAQFPRSDQFDFTQFGFGMPFSFPQPTTSPVQYEDIQAGSHGDNLETFATQSSITERAHNNKIGLDSSNSNIQKSPLGQSSAGNVQSQSGKHIFSNNEASSSSSRSDNNNIGIESLPNEGNNKNVISSSSNTCTLINNPSETKSSNSILSNHDSYSHLKRMKMKSLMQDKDVIRFQKQVLDLAARFYTDLGDIFENTPNETIKLGMSRTDILAQDDAISDVLEDIKSLCGRLTAKAANIPGYPGDTDDINMSREENSAGISPPAGNLDGQPQRLSRRTAQKGSLTEPIDLTAATPRSEGVTPMPLSNIPVIISTPQSVKPLTMVEYNQSVTPHYSPPDSRIRPPYDPFTPESLIAGPSSVLPIATTSSPLYPGSTPAQLSNVYTPSAHSISANTPSSKPFHDLPPLNPTANKVIHGPWKPSEVERLRTLVAFSRDVEDNAPVDHTDWTWVVDNFGGTRNRHQVLIKAVELGLRETSTHHSRRVKQKGYRDAIVAMETELKATSSKPLRSPLPPLLPSAEISTSTSRSIFTPNVRSPIIAPNEGNGVTSTPPGTGSKVPFTLGKGGRRESTTSVHSEPVHTSIYQVPSPATQPTSNRTVPRALDLSSPLRSTINTNTISTSPMRHDTSPYTPRSKISTMGFKPYAHFAHRNIPSTAPPRTSNPMGRHGRSHGRTLSGWRLVNMVGMNGDEDHNGGIRPTVISPTFGGYASAGYQLAPIPVLDRYEGNNGIGTGTNIGLFEKDS